MPLHDACNFQLIGGIPEQDQIITLRHTPYSSSQIFAGPPELEGRFAKTGTSSQKPFYKAVRNRAAPALLGDIGRNRIEIVQRPPC